MIGALPLVAASVSGVTPYRLAARTFAPARSSTVTVSTSSLHTAQWSGERPVDLRRVDVDALSHQRANRATVTRLGRRHECRVGFRRARRHGVRLPCMVPQASTDRRTRVSVPD